MSTDPEFNDLVGTWYDPLYRFAFSLSHNEDDAQDLTQATFLKWAKKGHTLREKTKAKTWLFSVLYREFLSQTRRAKKYAQGELEEDKLPALPENPDRRIDASAAVAAVGRLDERFRGPLVLFYLENHSYREIAAILDIPIGTVMSRLRRGKDRLRALMERAGAESSDLISFPPKEAQS